MAATSVCNVIAPPGPGTSAIPYVAIPDLCASSPMLLPYRNDSLYNSNQQPSFVTPLVPTVWNILAPHLHLFNYSPAKAHEIWGQRNLG